MKGVFGSPFELGQTQICHPPEAFDPVYMDAASRALILRMIDAEVPLAEVYQPVIAAPSVRVHHRLWAHPATHYPFCGVGFEPSGTISV